MPAVFRPIGIRIASVVLGALLFGVVAVIWLAFPAHVRDAFTFLQRLTVLLFGLMAVLAGYALGRSRVEAREEGLLTVNGFKKRLHPWDSVARVTLRAGGPWAIIELTDGSVASAMGIQGSDGERAVEQVKQLRRIMRARATGQPGAGRPDS
jgi:hypothetical protein